MTEIIGHFRNAKGTGAEMYHAINSGIVTGDARVSYWLKDPTTRRQREPLKNNSFNEQNDNFAHTPHIFVHFFALFGTTRTWESNFVFYEERK